MSVQRMTGAVIHVIRHSGWLPIVGVVIVFATFSWSAEPLARAVGLAFALSLLVGVFVVTWKYWPSQQSSEEPLSWAYWKRIIRFVVSGGALSLLAVLMFHISSHDVPDLAEQVVRWTGGDKDLTIALLLAMIVTLVSAITWAFYHVRTRANPCCKDARARWRETTGTLTLVIIGLVPAALLANWAWNVLASCLLPVFVLSARRALAEQPKG